MKKFIAILKNNPFFRRLNEDDIYTVLEYAGARAKAVKTDEYILQTGTKHDAGSFG